MRMTDPGVTDGSTGERKRALREAAKSALASMSETERRLRSRSLCAKLVACPGFTSARTVMVYLAMPEEVDLADLLTAADRGGKRVCVPKMEWSARTMQAMLIEPGSLKTEVVKHGVREPVGGNAVAPAAIDLTLVPGLAFDAAGRRLGRGAGFYDRFLKEFRAVRKPGAAAIGVCFDVQLVRDIPAEAHDQPVDGVATERGVVRCR